MASKVTAGQKAATTKPSVQSVHGKVGKDAASAKDPKDGAKAAVKEEPMAALATQPDSYKQCDPVVPVQCRRDKAYMYVHGVRLHTSNPWIQWASQGMWNNCAAIEHDQANGVLQPSPKDPVYEQDAWRQSDSAMAPEAPAEELAVDSSSEEDGDALENACKTVDESQQALLRAIHGLQSKGIKKQVKRTVRTVVQTELAKAVPSNLNEQISELQRQVTSANEMARMAMAKASTAATASAVSTSASSKGAPAPGKRQRSEPADSGAVTRTIANGRLLVTRDHLQLVIGGFAKEFKRDVVKKCITQLVARAVELDSSIKSALDFETTGNALWVNVRGARSNHGFVRLCSASALDQDVLWKTCKSLSAVLSAVKDLQDPGDLAMMSGCWISPDKPKEERQRCQMITAMVKIFGTVEFGDAEFSAVYSKYACYCNDDKLAWLTNTHSAPTVAYDKALIATLTDGTEGAGCRMICDKLDGVRAA